MMCFLVEFWDVERQPQPPIKPHSEPYIDFDWPLQGWCIDLPQVCIHVPPCDQGMCSTRHSRRPCHSTSLQSFCNCPRSVQTLHGMSSHTASFHSSGNVTRSQKAAWKGLASGRWHVLAGCARVPAAR